MMTKGNQRLKDYATRLSECIDAARAEEGLRALADTMPGIIWTADRSGRTTFISRRWYDVFGTPDMDWLAILHPDDREATLAAWMDSVATGQPYHRTARYRDAEGVWQVLVTRAHIARAPDGSAAYWLGTSSILDPVGLSLLRAA